MTSKVLIANYGPDPIRVRTVSYSTYDVEKGTPALGIEDVVIPIAGSREVWVHHNFQVLIGEHDDSVSLRSELLQKLSEETGLSVARLERYYRRPSSVELRRRAADILKPRDEDDQNRSE